MKDNFSSRSDQYRKYRPTYPKALFDYLNSIVPRKNKAWDCGTGNGQIAFELAKSFDSVFATDISQSQLDNALQADNISYSVQRAEKCQFDDQKFDLITAAQAIHWFDFEGFYKEVKRTGKKDSLICIIGYGRIEIAKEIDAIITDFYSNIIGKYWDPERKYLDENYESIPFPFKEIDAPKFENKQQWTLAHLIGYLNTWSAVKHFISQNGFNPIDDLEAKLKQHWDSSETKEVRFPILLRVGEVSKTK